MQIPGVPGVDRAALAHQHALIRGQVLVGEVGDLRSGRGYVDRGQGQIKTLDVAGDERVEADIMIRSLRPSRWAMFRAIPYS